MVAVAARIQYAMEELLLFNSGHGHYTAFHTVLWGWPIWKMFSRLIDGLTVGDRPVLFCFHALTTVIFISGILVNEKFIAINFSKREIVGKRFISVARDSLA